MSYEMPEAAGAGRRYRRFQITSQLLARPIIIAGLNRSVVRRYAAIIHDRDPGVETHAHVVIELHDARTRATVARWFEAPVPLGLVRVIGGTRGDPHSFARAVRYLTHESPFEQSKGKVLYRDDEVFASSGFDWRAEVDALTEREGFKRPKLQQYKLDMMAGTRTFYSIADTDPEFFAQKWRELKSWEQLLGEMDEKRRADRMLRARGYSGLDIWPTVSGGAS